MTGFETIRYTVEDEGILVITLDRPDRMNAFTPTMCAELVEAFTRASADDGVRAVIVNGAGRNFCAGMDLDVDGNVFGLDEAVVTTIDELDANPEQPSLANGVRDTGGKVTLAIRACRKPVIAAIHGAAVGIGATMTLAMDIRLATLDARIGFVFGRIGITPEACSTWYLPRLVGMQQALEWIYTAEPFPAVEAHAAGLVRSLHAPEELLPAARALALRFTRNRPPAAIAVARELLWRNSGEPTPWRAHLTESLAVHHLSQHDGKEGVAAFREKRLPAFSQSLDTSLPPGFPWSRFHSSQQA